MRLAVRVLGPLDVTWDDHPIPIRGAKERALLALLALDFSQTVSADRLVEDLWENQPPDSAPASLRVLVSRLRKTLAEAGAPSVILTRPPGYVLVGQVDVDAIRFEALAARGRAELTEGRAEVASATLGQALAMWRGPQVATAMGDTGRFQAARLEESRLAAVEARVEADLACARHRDLVGELEALTIAHPFREAFWAARMIALYRSGRQAEALAVYQSLRSLMADELGIDPSPALRRLERAILAQDEDLLYAGVRPAQTSGRTDETGTAPERLRVPLPPRMEVAPFGGLIGRRPERDLLSSAIRALVTGGGPRLVAVGGEAGVGKTTLLAEAARAAHAAGAVVLYGRADQDLAMPYQVFLEALGHYVAYAPDDMLARHSRRQLGELTRLMPALSARRDDLTGPTATDPDAERWLLFGAVASVLTEVAERAPVVAILDDLHWADRPSVQLLRHLARTHLGRVLVLVAFRDTELSPAHPLAEALTDLRRELAVERLAVTGLDEAETFALMEARSGHSLGPDARALAQALQQETGGNPFFVAEVLRHLAEIGAIAQRPDGRWTATADLSQAGLPDSVREVLSARVTRLGQDVSQVLSAAAVIGQEFDLDLLSHVSGLGEDRLLDLLETAARAQLVTEAPEVAGRFRFGHALSQHTLYDALGATRQARLHLQVAEGLEKICGDDPGDRVGQLARHYLASIRLAGADKAVTYACLAAERALAALAPDEAARWYGEALGALERTPDAAQRARLLAGLGNAQRQAGDPAHRETLLEAGRMARSLGRADILVAAALANNRGWQSGAGEVDAERVAMLETAVAALGDADSGDRAQLLALLALERTYDGNYPARRNLADAGLSIARRLGDPRALLGVLNRRYQAIWVPDTFEDRRSSTAEALALAAQDPDPVARFWAAIWRTAWAYEAGDRGEFIRCASMADHLCAEVGLPTQRWTSLFHQTTLALLSGDADKAEDLAAEALKLGTDTGQPDAVAIYGAQLVVVRWHQGRTEELIEMVRGIATALPAIPAYRAALALLCADAGREDDVRAMLDEETAAGFPHPHDYLLPSGMVAWSEAASLLRDQSAAALLYERLAAWPDQVAITGASLLGAVAHSLATLAGLLQWYDEAEHHFERALAIHKRLEAPFFIARTHLECGRMLLARGRRGDRDRGREMVQAAARLARRFGCSGVERRAADLLVGVRQGADPDRVLATVIFTDMVGSTELASRLGDRQWRSLLDQHDLVIRQELAEFSGQLVKTTGDGILATVESPARAIGCACAMRAGLKRLGIDIRVGIHTGEVERRQDDIGGVGVHVAARVLAVAEPGEVLVSRTVVDLVTGSGIEFEGRGEHELKGLPGPWLLFAVRG